MSLFVLSLANHLAFIVSIVRPGTYIFPLRILIYRLRVTPRSSRLTFPHLPLHPIFSINIISRTVVPSSGTPIAYT